MFNAICYALLFFSVHKYNQAYAPCVWLFMYTQGRSGGRLKFPSGIARNNNNN